MGRGTNTAGIGQLPGRQSVVEDPIYGVGLRRNATEIASHTITVPFDGKQFPVELHSQAVPGSGAIIVNYAGYNGTAYGYADKYVQLADIAANDGLAATVLVPNKPFDGYGRAEYQQSLLEVLRAAVAWARAHAEELCGDANPTLYLTGMSAGGSAVAALAAELEADKVLLVAPSGDAGEQIERLLDYTGEVSIVVGREDIVVGGARAGALYRRLAENASACRLQVLDNCDHQFTGEHNGRILSQVQSWAYRGNCLSLDPAAGEKLYD